MRTGRVVKFELYCPEYPYEGKITEELRPFQSPEDEVLIPIFSFEGKRLGETGIGGTFPLVTGQVFVDIGDRRDIFWRIRQVWQYPKALLSGARLIGLKNNSRPILLEKRGNLC